MCYHAVLDNPTFNCASDSNYEVPFVQKPNANHVGPEISAAGIDVDQISDTQIHVNTPRRIISYITKPLLINL